MRLDAFKEVEPSDETTEHEFNKLITSDGPMVRVLRTLWLTTEDKVELFLGLDLGSPEGSAAALKLQGEIRGKRNIILQLLAHPDDDKLVEPQS